MTKAPPALDAITDVVLAYRPAGTGENTAAIARKMARKTRGPFDSKVANNRPPPQTRMPEKEL